MSRLLSILKQPLRDGMFWTDRLHLVSGCTPVSAGCANCWMVTEARLRSGHPHPAIRVLHDNLLLPDRSHFNGNVRFNSHVLDKLKVGSRKPRVWAVWTDLHHEGIACADVIESYSRFASIPHDYFVVVTKRPEEALFDLRHIEPMKNVIILVTVEHQGSADKRGPYALELANQGWNVGFLAEPLLEPLYLSGWLGCGRNNKPSFKWLITGGESGAKARPAQAAWFRSLRDQAVEAGVPFMFKGWGTWRPRDIGPITDSRERMVRAKRNEGLNAWLGGRTWREVPDL